MIKRAKGFIHESTHNESKEWYTPVHIFRAMNINFDLDPCSPGHDKVPWIPAQIHYTVKDDGLIKEWFGNVYMNPPYGMDTPKWMDKLSKHGNGIALVFARTDTKWFHAYVPKADAICFIARRIGFVPHDKALLYADGQWETQGGCGAASMLVAYGRENAKALFHSGLGLTLSVISHTETFRATQDFAGGGSRPKIGKAENESKGSVAKPTHENPPRIDENRQRIIAEANAQIRRNNGKKN